METIDRASEVGSWATRLRSLRAAHGWDRRTAAARLGVTVRALVYWESGRRPGPSGRVLVGYLDGERPVPPRGLPPERRGRPRRTG